MDTEESKVGGPGLGDVLARLEGLIDWERRERAPGARGQAMRVDLGPITDLASLVGRPDRNLVVVHVAGSKGKGSVASLVAAGLRAAGLRVGRYGSPHVEHLSERIELEGRPVADALLAEGLGAALDAREVALSTGSAGAEATWFDVLTLAAMLVLRDAGIRHAVFECGLGGRLDSTNLLVGEVCVVTNIELEHTEILGATRAEIAFEKVSILGKSATLVTGVPPGPDEAGDVIDKHVAMQEAKVLRPDWVANPPADLERRNLDLAGLVLDELGSRGWGGGVATRPISAGLLEPAVVRAARLPGRLEAFELAGRWVVLDGAHVASSVTALLDDLGRRPGLEAPPTCIFGAGRDKDLAGLLKILAGRTDSLLCTTVGSSTAATPEDLARAAGDTNIEVVESPRSALDRALELAPGGGWILITGSLHLAGALRPLLCVMGRPRDLPQPC
ncbi:MAG: Mur ligase family protein [Planctomycetota bacterium]|nr:Mur ligase family protein [Planctomycetota bacterium]